MHEIRRAASRAAWTAGSNRPIRTAMIAITTRSSINVKAPRRVFFMSRIPSNQETWNPLQDCKHLDRPVPEQRVISSCSDRESFPSLPEASRRTGRSRRVVRQPLPDALPGTLSPSQGVHSRGTECNRSRPTNLPRLHWARLCLNRPGQTASSSSRPIRLRACARFTPPSCRLVAVFYSIRIWPTDPPRISLRYGCGPFGEPCGRNE